MIKVLIVDDNKDNRTTIKLLLEEYENIYFFEADNGKKAINIAKVSKPDIIFMDIMMPQMDGIEVTAAIREFDKECLIVALSVLSDDEHKSAILKAGADDYITKPINETLFAARMKNYLLLIEYRRKKERIEGATNLFAKDVYSKKIAFLIEDSANLAEFWEYAAQNSDNDSLNNVIKAIYNFGLYLLRKNNLFYIVCEENDDALFFSIVGLKSFVWGDIVDYFKNEHPIADIAIKKDAISICVPKKLKVADVVEKEKVVLDSFDEQILRMTHTDKITAKDFIAELDPDIMDKLERLEANEESLDGLVYDFETNKSYETLLSIAMEIEIYATHIDALYEFKNISYALFGFAGFLKGIKEEDMDDKKASKLAVIIRSISDDLTNWRKTIFVEQSAQDIHYLDSSLLSSCIQAELIFKDVSLEESDDELELF